MTTEEQTPPAELGYAGALAELEAILARLEGDDADVDVLAARVARAAELITFCRERILTARTDVERIVAGMDSAPTATDAGIDDTEGDE